MTAVLTIATPTFPGRESDLLDRCMPSVRALDWPVVEHVIVSDRNPDLRAEFDRYVKLNHPDRPVRFVEINETWRNPETEKLVGAVPWMLCSYLAMGDFIGFLGDDDELLPHHARTHIEAMQAANALWSLSQVDFRVGGNPYLIIGDESYELGHLDTTGIMCYKDALSVARWNPWAGENATDWQMVNDWRRAGLPGVFIPQITGIHHDGWAAGKSGRPDRPKG